MAVDQSSGTLDRELQLSLFSCYIDRVAVATIRELEAEGVRSVLLKGPAVANLLYCDGTPRPYGDADVLVSPEDWPRAQKILGDLGFTRELAPLDHPGMASFASEAWARGPGNIDLHCTLWGVAAAPGRVWEALAGDTQRLDLGGYELTILAPPAQAMLLATHAASHGDGWALTDLHRGIQMLPTDLWRSAAALAVELQAGPAFVAGMQLVEGGRDLVDQIGLSDAPLPEASLRAWRVPMALGLEQLAHTRGAWRKAVVILRELFPTPSFMRWWLPLASRGRRGLLAAYLFRFFWIARHATPAVRAWRRARRQGRAPVP